MTFSENLRELRKQRNLSQEELAAMLDVSRQAVSKWELDEGYPEVEKLLLIANKLNVSLDYLMGNTPAKENNHSTDKTRILIKSFNSKSIVSCYKVISSGRFRTKKDQPKYALFGVDGSSFWGDNTTVLGWYQDEESIQKEINDILIAMQNHESSYELKYAVDFKENGLLSLFKLQ